MNFDLFYELGNHQSLRKSLTRENFSNDSEFLSFCFSVSHWLNVEFSQRDVTFGKESKQPNRQIKCWQCVFLQIRDYVESLRFIRVQFVMLM